MKTVTSTLLAILYLACAISLFANVGIVGSTLVNGTWALDSVWSLVESIIDIESAIYAVPAILVISGISSLLIGRVRARRLAGVLFAAYMTFIDCQFIYSWLLTKSSDSSMRIVDGMVEEVLRGQLHSHNLIPLAMLGVIGIVGLVVLVRSSITRGSVMNGGFRQWNQDL